MTCCFPRSCRCFFISFKSLWYISMCFGILKSHTDEFFAFVRCRTKTIRNPSVIRTVVPNFIVQFDIRSSQRTLIKSGSLLHLFIMLRQAMSHSKVRPLTFSRNNLQTSASFWLVYIIPAFWLVNWKIYVIMIRHEITITLRASSKSIPLPLHPWTVDLCIHVAIPQVNSCCHTSFLVWTVSLTKTTSLLEFVFTSSTFDECIQFITVSYTYCNVWLSSIILSDFPLPGVPYVR